MGIFNTNMPKEGEIIHGKYGEYVLCNELGHGGNGFVFDIRIIENNYSVYQSTQRYVIKILILKKTRRTDEKEKRRIRFQREITAVRQVGNQKLDILPILDSYLDVANSRYEWYVMPKAKECKYLWHIESIIKLKYLRKLGETLSKLHKMGVYHRDIKPENILFYNNRLCLSDFGLVWTIQEDNHITGNLEAVGPARIRPPEMEYNIEKVKEDIDFQKVDAYLFVKTIWIILTGNRNGFRGEYNRADLRIYLNKNHLKLGRTVESLHRMMELATVHCNQDRITIEECLEYIDQQISIADGSIASNILDSLVYDENLSEIKNQIVTDAKLYYKPEKILFALSKMETSVEIVVNDFGEDFSVGILNKVELVNDNLFKLNLKNTFIVGSRKSIKRIYVRIAQLLIKDNENEIITEKLGLVSKKMTIVYNLADLLNSQDTEVAIDGICSLSIKRLSNY